MRKAKTVGGADEQLHIYMLAHIKEHLMNLQCTLFEYIWPHVKAERLDIRWELYFFCSYTGHKSLLYIKEAHYDNVGI